MEIAELQKFNAIRLELNNKKNHILIELKNTGIKN